MRPQTDHLGAILGLFWCHLGTSCVYLGSILRSLGAILGSLRAILVHLGATMVLPEGILKPFGSSGCHLGAIWTSFGSIWAPFWSTIAPFEVIFGLFQTSSEYTETCFASLGCFCPYSCSLWTIVIIFLVFLISLHPLAFIFVCVVLLFCVFSFTSVSTSLSLTVALHLLYMFFLLIDCALWLSRFLLFLFPGSSSSSSPPCSSYYFFPSSCSHSILYTEPWWAELGLAGFPKGLQFSVLPSFMLRHGYGPDPSKA